MGGHPGRHGRPGLGMAADLAGLLLAAWGVRSAAEVDLEHPHQLVLGGPYAVSRNPMYLAWAIVYVGIALVANTVWPLLLLPGVLLATHVRRRPRGAPGRSLRRRVPQLQDLVRRYL